MNLPQGKLTNALLLVNIAVWLLLWLARWEQEAIVRGGFFPLRVREGDGFFAEFTPLVPIWLTPLSAAFLHSGILHIGFNMLMLIFCGRFVEQALGPWGIGILYVVGAYVAAIAEYFSNPESAVPMVGASGAISAIIAAYALLYARNRVDPIGPIPGHIVRIGWLMAAWIGIQLMIGIATSGSLTQIAIFAHIGGFLAGLLLTKPLLEWRFRDA